MNAINEFFSKQFGAEMTVASSLGMLLLAILLGAAVAAVYARICRNSGAAKDMILTLTFLPAVVCAIILLVGNNVVYALSMGGIFTLVRWRSQQTSQQDLLFTLYGVAAGAACGIGFAAYGVMFTVIIGAVMIGLDAIRYGESSDAILKLRITVPEDLNLEGAFDEELKQFTKNYELIEMRSSNFGSLYDLIYTVRLGQDTSRKDFIDAIRVKNGNLNVSLTKFAPEKKK